MSCDARRSLIAPSYIFWAFENARAWAGGFDPKQSADWRVSTESQKPQHLASYFWVISNAQQIPLSIWWSLCALVQWKSYCILNCCTSFWFVFDGFFMYKYFKWSSERSRVSSPRDWRVKMGAGSERGREQISWLWTNTLINQVCVSCAHLKTNPWIFSQRRLGSFVR